MQFLNILANFCGKSRNSEFTQNLEKKSEFSYIDKGFVFNLFFWTIIAVLANLQKKFRHCHEDFIRNPKKLKVFFSEMLLGKCSSRHVKCSFETLAKFHGKSLKFHFEVQKCYKKHFFRKTLPPNLILCARRMLFWHIWPKFSLLTTRLLKLQYWRGKYNFSKNFFFIEISLWTRGWQLWQSRKKNFSPKRCFFGWKTEDICNIVQSFNQCFSSKCFKAL